MPGLEHLFGPTLKGPLHTAIGQANAFAGRTVVASGGTTVTVSTTFVKSDSLILTGVSVASGAISSGGLIVVQSVVDSVSFAFARQASIARDDTVMWLIVNQR